MTLNIMQEEITKNNNDIITLRKSWMNQKAVKQPRQPNTSSNHAASILHTLDELAREINLRNENKREVYVRAINEKAAADVLSEISKKEVSIKSIIELPKPMED